MTVILVRLLPTVHDGDSIATLNAVCGESSPSGHDRSKPNALFLHAVVVLDEQHYKSGACVSCAYDEVLFGACDGGVGERAYEDDEPYVLPQH